MLIKVDRSGKTKSVFKCDRCEKIISTDVEERFKLTVQNTPTSNHCKPIKSWDLCKRCYGLIYKGIEKGVTRDK